MVSGIGLLEWVMSFADSGSIGAQAELHRALDRMKLQENASLDTFELHCTSMLLMTGMVGSSFLCLPCSAFPGFVIFDLAPRASLWYVTGLKRSNTRR